MHFADCFKMMKELVASASIGMEGHGWWHFPHLGYEMSYHNHAVPERKAQTCQYA